MNEIRGHKILDAVRGMKTVNKKLLTDMLINIGRIGMEIPEISEIDLNPVIISESEPVVVDALIVLEKCED